MQETITRQPLVNVSERAIAEVARLTGDSDQFLRIWVTEGGCAGMTYEASVDATETPFDRRLFTSGEVRIVADRQQRRSRRRAGNRLLGRPDRPRLPLPQPQRQQGVRLRLQLRGLTRWPSKRSTSPAASRSTASTRPSSPPPSVSPSRIPKPAPGSTRHSAPSSAICPATSRRPWPSS